MTVRPGKQPKKQSPDSSDLYSIMQQLLLRENKTGRSRGHFWVMCLNDASQVVLIERIGLGSTRVSAHPSDIFGLGLQKKATKLILVHSYADGSLEISKTDLEETIRIWAIGDFVQMPLIDHLIIAESGYRSLADAGMMDIIARERLFDLKAIAAGKVPGQKQSMKAKQQRETQKPKVDRTKHALRMGAGVKISGRSKNEIEG